jgi:hypothetical protein
LEALEAVGTVSTVSTVGTVRIGAEFPLALVPARSLVRARCGSGGLARGAEGAWESVDSKESEESEGCAGKPSADAARGGVPCTVGIAEASGDGTEPTVPVATVSAARVAGTTGRVARRAVTKETAAAKPIAAQPTNNASLPRETLREPFVSTKDRDNASDGSSAWDEP